MPLLAWKDSAAETPPFAAIAPTRHVICRCARRKPGRGAGPGREPYRPTTLIERSAISSSRRGDFPENVSCVARSVDEAADIRAAFHRVEQVSLTPFMVKVALRPLIQNSMPALAYRPPSADMNLRQCELPARVEGQRDLALGGARRGELGCELRRRRCTGNAPRSRWQRRRMQGSQPLTRGRLGTCS